MLGLEWLASVGADSMLQAYQVRDLKLLSTQAETVTGFGLQVRDIGASDTRPSSIVEVFADGQQHVNGPVITGVYAPSADVTAESDIGATQWRGMPGADLTDLYQYIDEATPPVGAGDYLDFRGGSSSNRYVFQIASGAFPVGGRVLNVRLRLLLASIIYGGGPAINRQFAVRILRISDGATRTPIQGSGIFASPFSTSLNINMGEVNPFTDRPWLPADIIAFAPGGDYAIRIEAVGDTNVAAAIMWASVEVQYMAVENRLAVGMWRRPASQASGVITTTSLITLPGGAASWSKPGSGTQIYRWRIPRDNFIANPITSTVHWRTAAQYLESAAGEAGPYGVTGEVVTMDQYSLTAAAVPSRAAGALNLIVAGSPSSDSQPYWLPQAGEAGIAESLTAHSAQSVEQRFTPGSTQSYLPFRFLVSPPPAGHGTTLTLSIRRVSDNVQMGGAFVLNEANLGEYPTTFVGTAYRIIADFLSAATGSLVSGTQYALRWTVTGPAGPVWRLPLMRTSTAGNPSFGGTSDCAATRTEPGGVATTITDMDVPGVLLQQPAAPVSATAAVVLTPTRLGVSCFCGLDGIEDVLLSWAPSAIAGFVRIEVERYLDRGKDTDAWHLVFRKLSNPVTQDAKLTDREVPRGTSAKYRLRYIDANGSFSEWTETDWVTPQARGCELILTSNEVPDITVVYNHEPAVGYGLLDYASDVLMPIDGADYQMAFVESERRGVSKTVRIIANFGRPPCDDLGRPIGKEAIWEPLIRATRAVGAPYVCVLDSDGNRVFAHVGLDRPASDEPGWRYHVDATVTPITGEPLPVDVP